MRSYLLIYVFLQFFMIVINGQKNNFQVVILKDKHNYIEFKDTTYHANIYPTIRFYIKFPDYIFDKVINANNMEINVQINKDFYRLDFNKIDTIEISCDKLVPLFDNSQYFGVKCGDRIIVQLVNRKEEIFSLNGGIAINGLIFSAIIEVVEK